MFSNSVSADRNGMVASTFRFAPESHESQCNGCMKVANGVLAAIFHFGVDNVPFKILCTR